MKKFSFVIAAAVLLAILPRVSKAQTGGLGTGIKGGQEIPVTTAVPFLRIIPDARSGGMGDVGIGISADANAIFHNPAKLAFAEKPLGISMSYVPWLRSLVNDIYMANLAAYYKLDDLQALGMSMRYFSLGNIQFTNVQGENTGEFKPNEFAIDAAYSRQLVKIKKGGGFSAALALRFIYSNLATGQTVNGIDIKPGLAGAADIAFAYNQDFKIKNKYKTNLAVGLNLSNIGSKITYTESAEKDFIPMNFGLGTTYSFNFDDHNQLNLSADMNKLLVPTPDTADADNNGTYDYRETSVPSALFTSWGDAPGGIREELHEITWSVGLEYWYDQQFAVRAGYFHEYENKGNRQFFTAGLGLRFKVFGLDFSYLIPTSTQRNPLDNTMRFTLMFQFENFKKKQETQPAGTSSL
ncbi:MAG TPA: type IX secretion system outer membrane channel protein PorV [Chitinophagales bacterium]|nr:type IX secretion system outer membrane channel protein PorV [Chitinophagales bacterium]